MNFIDAETAKAWADALLRVSMQGAIVIVLVALILRMLRSLPPAAHVWAWRLVLAKMLLGVALTLPIVVEGRAVLPGQTNALSGSATGGALAPALVVALSILGGGIALVLLLLDWRAARLLRLAANRCERSAIVVEVARIADRLRMRKAPAVHESPLIERPMLLGSGQPIVVLPKSLLDMENVAAISAVLGHELAHLKRRDLRWGWLAAATQAIFFFHPLVWFAQNRLRSATDEACDALALQHTQTTPADYGRMLVRLAQGLPGPALSAPVAAGVVEPFHSLRDRLRNLGRPRTPLRVLPLMALAVVCVVAAPTWRTQERTHVIDLHNLLYVETPDGRPMTVPVIFGDGPDAVVIPFTSEGTVNDALALPLDPLTSGNESGASDAPGDQTVRRRDRLPARLMGTAGRENPRFGAASPIAFAVSSQAPAATGGSRFKELSR